MHDLNTYFNFQSLIIRNVLKNDVPKLVPIINEAYSYTEEIRKRPRTNNENLLEKIHENNYYAILDHENIIGCFYINIHSENMHFGMFALSPDYRGIGLGKEILRAIECFAKSKSIKTIEIDRMSVSPWLKKYYENQGFTESGKIEQWGEIDLIHMRKNI